MKHPRVWDPATGAFGYVVFVTAIKAVVRWDSGETTEMPLLSEAWNRLVEPTPVG